LRVGNSYYTNAYESRYPISVDLCRFPTRTTVNVVLPPTTESPTTDTPTTEPPTTQFPTTESPTTDTPTTEPPTTQFTTTEAPTTETPTASTPKSSPSIRTPTTSTIAPSSLAPGDQLALCTSDEVDMTTITTFCEVYGTWYNNDGLVLKIYLGDLTLPNSGVRFQGSSSLVVHGTVTLCPVVHIRDNFTENTQVINYFVNRNLIRFRSTE
jgi:hypothetical protein